MHMRYFVLVIGVMALGLSIVGMSYADDSTPSVANPVATLQIGYRRPEATPVKYCVDGVDPNGPTRNPTFTQQAKEETGYMPKFYKSTMDRCFATQHEAETYGKTLPGGALIHILFSNGTPSSK